jgi:hypothetical protein
MQNNILHDHMHNLMETILVSTTLHYTESNHGKGRKDPSLTTIICTIC